MERQRTATTGFAAPRALDPSPQLPHPPSPQLLPPPLTKRTKASPPLSRRIPWHGSPPPSSALRGPPPLAPPLPPTLQRRDVCARGGAPGRKTIPSLISFQLLYFPLSLSLSATGIVPPFAFEARPVARLYCKQQEQDLTKNKKKNREGTNSRSQLTKARPAGRPGR